ncbi:serine hydrolase domain-containing protein [Aliikangiella marina]|nr:serine hydrolase domain-containing protein [Aliikangiella marina]
MAAEDRFSQVQLLAQNLVKNGDIKGIQAAFIKGGEITYQFSYEHSIANATPLDNDTKLRVASISKLVVALTVLMAVDEKRLKLDQDVSTYLQSSFRNPHFSDQKITLRHLLSHTSSIRDGTYYWAGPGDSITDFFDSNGKHFNGGEHFSSTHEPGAYFQYSNLAFGVIASILESVYQQRFDEIVTRKLLKPMGLSARFSACNILKETRNLGALYRKQDADGKWRPNASWREQVDGHHVQCFYGANKLSSDSGVAQIEQSFESLKAYLPGNNGTLFSPQGGLRASASDIAKILIMIDRNGRYGDRQILSKVAIAELFKVQWQFNEPLKNGNTGGETATKYESDGLMTQFGLSLHQIDGVDWGLSKASKKLFGHLGFAYGLLGQAWLDEAGNGMVLLVTGTADDPAKAPSISPLYQVEESLLSAWLESIE